MLPEKLPQGYYTKTGTVLLRKESLKEGQSLLILMRDLGARWVSAPRASAKNRFGGAAEPLTWAEYSLYQSASRLYLRGADVKEDFMKLRSMPSSLLAAVRIYGIAAKELPKDCENDGVLRLLWSTLIQLQNGTPAAITEFRFVWRMLHLLGSAPTFDVCSLCGVKVTCGGTLTNDGFLCAKCSGRVEISQKETSEIQAAALLPHEKFIVWSKENKASDPYAKNLKKLFPYFKNLR
ncbi:MAG: DNA repair protein RecO [Synergistes sp.]|nr:DNA repair protein RecO [Synergistes sp.]